jgi:EAL domain-containing protein (putative c-di-GMP-specific phosphodiesterase class I)
MVLYYQPVAQANTGRVIALEALVRWVHPTRGLVAPGEFVPVAEGDPHTIWELTAHTLRLAINECASWQRRGLDVGVGVNLSSATIDRPDLVDEIGRILAEADLAPHRLTLEVTESALMNQPARVAEALAEMRSGESAAIAIDDFGTGYSSLARLEQLPVDTLKIDQTFLRRADDDRRESMLRSIINLAHGLGLTACAEGVEDVDTWRALVGLGCDTVQGYAISRPMPAAEVPGWLERSLTPAPVA